MKTRTLVKMQRTTDGSYKVKHENEKKLKKWLLEKYTNQVGGERHT
jgi:hypothetical protein